jgi:GrpB-like predicted nucleotidyltransferase (UPF0157 family)
MTGTVEHMNIAEAKSSRYSQQSRLSAFNDEGDRDTTYVGVVSEGDEEFERTVDEMRPELGPPSVLFHQWLNTRDSKQDEMSSVEAHNRALDEVNFRERFGKYLDSNREARDALEELTDRVEAGEHIVLVGYCDEGKWCHREPVAETIKSMVDERVDDQ